MKKGVKTCTNNSIIMRKTSPKKNKIFEFSMNFQTECMHQTIYDCTSKILTSSIITVFMHVFQEFIKINLSSVDS